MTEHFENYRVFYCWLPKSAFLNYVRSECVPDELSRITELSDAWSVSRKKFLEVSKNTKGLGKAIIVREIPPNYSSYTLRIANSRPFKATFNQLSFEFKIVEIDKLVALQNFVNLGYVDKLVKSMPKNPSFDELLDLCLSFEKEIPKTSELCTQKYAVYGSENSDIRFLGAASVSPDVVKNNDITVGGIAAKAIVLVFGYGASPINVFNYGGRMFLNNGFHRVYALRSIGVKHIPVIVQKITDPSLEMPAIYTGELMNQISTSDRLPLMQDLFNKDLTIDLKVKPKRKAVKVSWNIDYINVAV